MEPAETIHARGQAVRRLLFHAYDTVPYYRSLFIAQGWHPSDFRCLEDLEVCPSDEGRHPRNAAALRSSAFDSKAVTLKKTSGSTGVPLEIAVNRDSMEWKRLHHPIRRMGGWKLGRRVARYGAIRNIASRASRAASATSWSTRPLSRHHRPRRRTHAGLADSLRRRQPA
jgi:phenylacetate-CoA ligase